MGKSIKKVKQCLQMDVYKVANGVGNKVPE